MPSTMGMGSEGERNSEKPEEREEERFLRMRSMHRIKVAIKRWTFDLLVLQVISLASIQMRFSSPTETGEEKRSLLTFCKLYNIHVHEHYNRSQEGKHEW